VLGSGREYSKSERGKEEAGSVVVVDKKGKSHGCGFHTGAGMEWAFSVSNIDLLRESGKVRY
jgi:hypothetical protein